MLAIPTFSIDLVAEHDGICRHARVRCRQYSDLVGEASDQATDLTSVGQGLAGGQSFTSAEALPDSGLAFHSDRYG